MRQLPIALLLFGYTLLLAEASFGQDNVALVCIPKMSHLLVTVASDSERISKFTPAPDAWESSTEVIDVEPLVTYAKNGHRTGSKSIHRRCGPYKVRIYAETPNSNPNGEDGAFVFPAVTVRYRDTIVMPHTVISTQCASGHYRFGSCSKEWAAAVNVSYFEKNVAFSYPRVYVTYSRSYTESHETKLQP